MFRFARCAAIGIALMLSATTFASAQYPNRPVTIIVPLAAGSGMDVLVRLYADRLSQGPRQAGDRGESSRRLADARRECGRAIGARRPHAAGLHLVRDGDQPHLVQAGHL
jgi:hypothetical protein